MSINWRDLELRLRQSVDLYLVTKYSLYFSFAVN